MATLTVTNLVEDGVDVTTVTPAGAGDVFDNTGRELIVVYNDTVGTVEITVTAATTSFTSGSYGLSSKSDAVHTVAAGAVALLGPFPRAAYNDGNEQVQVVSDTTTDVKIGVVKYA